MKLTLSCIKADVGSVGGHTQPSERMLEAVRQEVKDAMKRKLIIDGWVSHTGDDIAILMSHTRGENCEEIHQFAWNCFIKATEIAREYGLYGAGQDLLADAPSGNIRGAGPAVVEIEFEHKLAGDRPAESFLLFTADKCGPGAYNLPLFQAFADPMFCAGLMLPKMIKGFQFNVIDMDNTKGDSIIELNLPEDYYKAAALLRDNERFGIDSIHARNYDEKAVSISAHRLHSIAGTYTGKDDPIALVRTQGIFPAPEEIVSTFTRAHFVGGDARGSHNMPIMPVGLNQPVVGPYCLPIVACAGFSVTRDGHFSDAVVDFFGNEAWDEVRLTAQRKGIEMRSQGWSGPAMLPYTELEYGGFRDTVGGLLEKFEIKNGKKSSKKEKVRA